MGQIVGGAAKPKRCNLNKLSQLGTPAAGEYILVSSDNSMNAAGQGDFDAYVKGDGVTPATELKLKSVDNDTFDISAYHATGDVLAKYVDLSSALDGGSNIPEAFRKGGMSVKFVRSSDNKYVQYFLTKDEWSASVDDWEKINLEEEVSQIEQKIGDNGQTYNLTSSDYAGMWCNGSKVFASLLNQYNGFLILLAEGTRYFWTATTHDVTVFSGSPNPGTGDNIIGRVSSGFEATAQMKYLLISIALKTTTEMTLTDNGRGLVKTFGDFSTDFQEQIDSIDGKIDPNTIVPVKLVVGGLGSEGRLYNNQTDKMATETFIDVSKNVLRVSGANPRGFFYYDKNKVLIGNSTNLNQPLIDSASFVRINFPLELNPDGFDNLVIVNDYFQNKEQSTFVDLTAKGVQINNGLDSTSASGVIMSYDKSSGLVAAPMAGGWLQYGESGSKIMLSVFPLNQSTNIRYKTIAEEGQSMGNDHIYHAGIDVNVISLGSRVWRIMILSYRGNPSECFWVYRDYHYDTDTLDDAVEIKMNYGGNLLSLSTANRKSVINAISGLTDNASDRFVSIGSSLDYHEDTGTYYGCITGYGNGDNVYTLLFYSTDDMATLIPFAVFPYITQFEASCVKIDSRLYIIARGKSSIHTGYSDDNGNTWTYKEVTGTNNRTRLYNVDGVPLWCYSIKSSTSETHNRGKVAIAHSTNPEDVSLMLDNDYGIVYFDVILKNGKMYIAYSCSPLTIDLDNGKTTISGKDCVMFTKILFNP